MLNFIGTKTILEMQKLADRDNLKVVDKETIQTVVLEENEPSGGGSGVVKPVTVPQPIGYLENTKMPAKIAVYKKLTCLQKFAWKCLLGFKYTKA